MSGPRFRLLHQDEWLVAIDKPAGFHVHPPEDPSHRISRNTNCLHLLSTQLDRYLYPVHRLDRATSGVLLFALTPEVAGAMGKVFTEHRIQKTYVCVTRGWTAQQETIDRPLKSENGETRLEATTAFERLKTVELPHAVGRYSTARYSLLRVQPKTGRMHQIRRHLSNHSHPLVGDTVYGDGGHNRLFREKWDIHDLLLRAHRVEFEHPVTGAPLRIEGRWNGLWHQVFDLFGLCPWESRS